MPPSPRQRLDLLSRRLFNLATLTTNPLKDNIDARALYVGFRALAQMNFDQYNHHQNNNNNNQRRHNNNKHTGTMLQQQQQESIINFEPLFNLFQRAAKSMPVKHIPPCLFALTHNSNQNNSTSNNNNNNRNRRSFSSSSSSFSISSADLEIHQTRLATSVHGSVIRELPPEDAVSLLHSLATHGSIHPLLRQPLYERIAQVLPELKVNSLCSIFYSLAILGLRTETEEAKVFLSQLQTELHQQSNKSVLFSLSDLARVVPKVANSSTLGFRAKIELVQPLLPRIASLVEGIAQAEEDGTTKRKGTHQYHHQRSSSSSYLSECTVLFLSIAKLRSHDTNAYHSLFRHLSSQIENMTSRQKVITLFAIFNAGELPKVKSDSSFSSLRWYAKTCLSICKDEQDIEHQLQTRKWDHVTLSYYVTVLSFGVDLIKQQHQQQQHQHQILENPRDFENLQDIKSVAIKISNRYDNKNNKRNSSSVHNNNSKASPTHHQSKSNSSSRDFLTMSSAKAQSLTNRKSSSMAASSSSSSFNRNREETEHDLSDSNNNTNSIEQEYPHQMNSVQRLQHFNNFVSSTIFNNTNNTTADHQKYRRQVEEHVKILCKTVHFQSVPTSTIVAYLRTLGRLRFSFSSSSSTSQQQQHLIVIPYDGALSTIFGEPILGGGGGGQQREQHQQRNSSSTNINASSSSPAPRRDNDPVDEPPGPRMLFPSEAATILVVMARIPLRRPYLISRLCQFIQTGASDISISLRANVLHSLGELRYPHRGCYEAVIGKTENRQLEENSNTESLSLSSIIQKHHLRKQQKKQQLSIIDSELHSTTSSTQSQSTQTDLSYEIQRKGTIVNAVHCLIGISFSDNVARYQELSSACLTRLSNFVNNNDSKSNNQKNTDQSNMIMSRSLKIQLPFALAVTTTSSTSSINILAKSIDDAISFFKEDQYRQTFLGEHWSNVLFWKHSLSPLLEVEKAEEYEKIVAAFIKHKLSMIYTNDLVKYRDHHPRPRISIIYQLACGFEMDVFPLLLSSSEKNSESKSDENELTLTRLDQIQAFASRMKFAQNELQRNAEYILPSTICLAKFYEELIRAMHQSDSEQVHHQSSCSSSASSIIEIDRTPSFQSLQQLSSELFSVLESNCIRAVSRSDDLALMLLSMRNLLLFSSDTILDLSEQLAQKREDNNDANTNHENIIRNKLRFFSSLLPSSTSSSNTNSNDEETMMMSSSSASSSNSSSNTIISSILQSNVIPLCRSIIAALYIRESAPSIGSISPYREHQQINNNNSHNNQNQSQNNKTKMMTIPTSQLTGVGLRLLCQSLQDGVYFEGEEELFEIALAVISLSIPRLQSCLSSYDAAVCLKCLMNVASSSPNLIRTTSGTNNSNQHQHLSNYTNIYSVMDILSQIVQQQQQQQDHQIPKHHKKLCNSVLPGLGQLGQESSLLSL